MRTLTHLAAAAAALVAAALAGCANTETHATFVTKTSVSLLDVDSTPAGVSFGYQRTEGYLGPRLKDGAAVPVVGFINTDGSLLGRSLEQVYATGCAAEVVSGAASAATPPKGSACIEGQIQDEPRPMFFATGTTLGVGFGLGEGNAPSLTLGYRRKEASVIPVDPGAMPSVLARHGNVVQAKADGTRPAGEIGIAQYFATGRAASALAGRKEVVDLFRDRTDSALGIFRRQERAQSEHALTTLGCLSRLPDARLPDAMRNAAALGVLPTAAQPETLEQQARTAPAAARERYTRFLVILNPDSADTTALMNLHRSFVCGLANA